jgi:hypothetical protein
MVQVEAEVRVELDVMVFLLKVALAVPDAHFLFQAHL